MDKRDIKKLFPIKAQITQEIINSGCSIGDECLKAILPKELHEDMFWGLSIGSIGGIEIGCYQTILHKGKSITIPFYLQRSDITKPIEITFELRKNL